MDFQFYIDRDRQPMRTSRDASAGDRFAHTEVLWPDGTWVRYVADPTEYSPIAEDLASEFAAEWVADGVQVDLHAPGKGSRGYARPTAGARGC